VTIIQKISSADNLIINGGPRDYMLASTGIFTLSAVNYKVRNQLGAYLAGLIESDGHIHLPSNPNSTPRIEITFHSNNLPLVMKLFEAIGFGFVRHLKGQNACRLVIGNIEGLHRVVVLVNGLFRTPKIASLHVLIAWLNTRVVDPIEMLPIDESSLITNAWLAGFSEGDSGFYIRITEQKFNFA